MRGVSSGLGSVWVVGSNRGLGEDARRAAHRLGSELARHGFRLIVGDWRGVDEIVARAFVAELRACGVTDVRDWITQVRRWRVLPLRWLLDEAAAIEVSSSDEEFDTPAELCQACVVVGGIGGAGESARRARAKGKPVFPLPMTEGDSRDLFHEIMRDARLWDLEGVTASQFLLLYTSRNYGVDGVLRMLRAVRTTAPHTFVSYRRADAEVAAGRLYADLIEAFGPKGVFMDTASLPPGSPWPEELRTASTSAQVTLAVIGPAWQSPRLHEDGDWVRREIMTAQETGSRVVPLLVGGTEVPDWEALPQDLGWMRDCQALEIHNRDWSKRVEEIVAVIEGELVRRPRQD